ncbi:MAG: SCO family protein [Chitinophagaceae bacterium]
MNKKALYAVMLAMLLPLVCYLVVKKFSETAVAMPGYFLPDSVTTKIEKGKSMPDTIWHQLSDFSLTNQEGRKVSWKDLTYKDSEEDTTTRGKIVVADFFFTHCPSICPRLTANMKILQETINNSQRVGDRTPNFLHLLSFSIDPERDSVAQLKQWANRFQVNPDQWWLLTGDKKTIYDMVLKEMKMYLIDGHGIDTDFVHTDFFVLIDGNRHVRGYYHGLDTMEVKQLASDIIMLSLEKDSKRKSFFAGKLQVIAVAFLAAIFGVGLLLFILRKKKNVPSTSPPER